MLFKSMKVLGVGAAALIGAQATADVVTIDFSVEDDGVTPLTNGQEVGSPEEFGTLFTLTASGNNQGAAIFDSNPAGPNSGGSDADLLVDLGNVLILQDNANDDQTIAGFFDEPDDANEGGTFLFSFLAPVELNSITLVDIDNNAAVTIVITDGSGFQRTYEVADNFTFDIDNNGSGGYEALDLASMEVQIGEGGGSAVPSEDSGFDGSNVVSMSIALSGSGAIDNLVFTEIPAPGALALLGLAGLCGVSGRRRQRLRTD